MILHNRRYFTRQLFEITNSSLAVTKRTLLDQYEFEIPFEQIHNKMSIQKISNSNPIVLSIAAVIIGFLFLFGSLYEASPIFFLIGLIFGIISIFSRKSTVTIPTYKDPIELFFKSSNKEEMKQFASEIIKASNSFLLKKYGKVDKALPIEPQIEKLHFLLDREIINTDEFEQLKNQLLSRDNLNSIGFSR